MTRMRTRASGTIIQSGLIHSESGDGRYAQGGWVQFSGMYTQVFIVICKYGEGQIVATGRMLYDSYMALNKCHISMYKNDICRNHNETAIAGRKGLRQEQ